MTPTTAILALVAWSFALATTLACRLVVARDDASSSIPRGGAGDGGLGRKAG